MKLIELLQTLEPDQLIKIGAKDGTSFFYVGTPKDVLDTFDSKSKRAGEYDMLISAANDNAIEKVTEQSSVMYEQVAKEYKNAGELPAILRAVFRSDNVKAILKMENRYDKLITQRKMTKPLKNREVMGSFESDPIADENVYAIIVEGYEQGKFWHTDEVPTGLGGRIKPILKINNMEGI